MRVLWAPFIGGRIGFGLLVLRVVAGVGLALHGWQKLQRGPADWMGPNSPYPDWLEAMAVVAEFCGGIALVLGLFTPIAALLIAINFVFAVNSHVQRGDGYVGGAELAAMYLATGVAYLLAGPGRYSFDALIFGQTRGEDVKEPLETEEASLRKRAKLM